MGSGSGFRPRAIFVARCPGVCRGRSTRIYYYADSRLTPTNQRRGLRLPRGGRLQNNLWYVRDNQHSLHSVVAGVEPETHDVSDELLREHRKFRLETARKPREMGLLVLLEAAGVSDSFHVRVRDRYRYG